MMRARLTLIAFLALLCATAPAFAQNLGDANGDGDVNSLDADHIADFAFGIVGAVTNAANADVNRDGIVDMRDALAVGQAGLRPLILFTNPSFDNKVVNDSTIAVKGTVLVHSTTTVSAFTINGSAVALAGGAFNHNLDLAGGNNTITAQATESVGGMMSSRVTNVIYLKVDGLSVERGRPEQSVTINGAGFDPTAGNMFVFFYPGEQAAITSLSATAITATIPNNVGAMTPGKDGITVVRKAPNGSLVPTKEPKAFFPRRHEQILNINTIDPDSTKSEEDCTAEGGNFIGGFCIRHIDMHPVVVAGNGISGTATVPKPPNPTASPDPVPKQGGTADIDIDTGWFYTEFYYADDPFVSGAFPLLLGVSAADFTRVPVSSAGYDVINILDNRDPAPLIYLQSPLNGTQTQEDEIEVYGSVNNSSVVIENVTMGLSYNVGTSITFFTKTVPLTVGDNVIKVTATDAMMREDVKQVTVTRIPLVKITYHVSDKEPDTGSGADPDPAKKNASGLNFASLVVTLNTNPVDKNDLKFIDNDAGGAEFDPDDLSTLRYDVNIVYQPGISDLINGSNTTNCTIKDNVGNEVAVPVEETFNANF